MKNYTLAELQKIKLREQAKINYYESNDEISIADEMAIEESKRIIAKIDEKLEPESSIVRGLGGEIVPPSDSCKDGMALTVKREDKTTIQASVERVDLVDSCGAYNLAFDASEAAETQNPMEQMLIHQMAAAHKHAMEVLAKSTQQNTIEQQAMLINSSAKLMNVYQKAFSAYQKTKSSGKQTITVQHVNISDNAQAIVNPDMKGRG